MAVSDIRLILLLDICTFFITITTVALVRKSIGKPVRREKQSALAEFREGFAVLKECKALPSLIALMAVACFFVGFLQTLVSPMVLAVSDAKTVGILESVCAVGMLVGSVIIGILGIRGSYVRTLSFAGMAASVCIAVSGVSVRLPVTGAGIFLFFLALPFLNTSADVLVRSNVAGEVQGRVWGIISLLSQAGTAVAYVFSGVLADHIFEPLLSEQGLLADILFGDEPTGALNSSATLEVMDIMTKINRDGTAILLVTHDANVAAKADRVIYLEDGRIKDILRLGKYTEDEQTARERQMKAWLERMKF